MNDLRFASFFFLRVDQFLFFAFWQIAWFNNLFYSGVLRERAAKERSANSIFVLVLVRGVDFATANSPSRLLFRIFPTNRIYYLCSVVPSSYTLIFFFVSIYLFWNVFLVFTLKFIKCEYISMRAEYEKKAEVTTPPTTKTSVACRKLLEYFYRYCCVSFFFNFVPEIAGSKFPFNAHCARLAAFLRYFLLFSLISNNHSRSSKIAES